MEGSRAEIGPQRCRAAIGLPTTRRCAHGNPFAVRWSGPFNPALKHSWNGSLRVTSNACIWSTDPVWGKQVDLSLYQCAHDVFKMAMALRM